MKILIVVSDFPKVTETFVLSNMQHYVAQGEEVSLFHIKPFRENELIQTGAESLIKRAFDFSWFGSEARAACWWAFSKKPRQTMHMLGQILAGFCKQPKRLVATLAIVPKSLALARYCMDHRIDHIHAEFAGYPATTAWIASGFSGVKFSFSAHAHDIFLTQTLLVEKAQSAAFVRCISEFNRHFLQRLPEFPENKLKVLRCGVTFPDKVPDALKLDQEPLRILFVGALLPRKGIDHLLTAVAGLPEKVSWQLDIIGGGDRLSHYQNQSRTLGLTNVVFHGALPSHAVRQKMAQSHLLVVPSLETEDGRSEGIPVVIMEALSLAKPVIASRLSGIPELVEDGVTGFLSAPDDSTALKEALLKVQQDYSTACRLGQAGRNRISENYDIQKTADALLQEMKAS